MLTVGKSTRFCYVVTVDSSAQMEGHLLECDATHEKMGLKHEKNGPIHELPQSSKYPLFLALSLNMIYSRGG